MNTTAWQANDTLTSNASGTTAAADGVGATAAAPAAGGGSIDSTSTVLADCAGSVSPSGPTFDYDAPSLTAVLPSLGPRWGGQRVTLMGSNFGPDGEGGIGVSFGAAGTSAADWRSDGAAVCSVPAGSGQEQPVEISVGGQSSATNKLARSLGVPIP